MMLARVLVTIAGAAAIGWVLWYFLALPSPRRVSRGEHSGR